MKNVEKISLKMISVILVIVLIIIVLPIKNNISVFAQSDRKYEYVVYTKKNKKNKLIREKYKIHSDKYTKCFEKEGMSLCEITKKEAKELSKERDVYIEENIQFEGSTQVINTKDIVSDWSREMINADNVDIVISDDKVKISVIDSGIDFSEDINVKERYNLIPSEENVSPLYDDLTGHGTGVAGIIASEGKNSNVKGVNNNVEIYSIKVFDVNNSAPLSRIIEAIYKAIEYDVDIINMSFGAAEYIWEKEHIRQQMSKKGC